MPITAIAEFPPIARLGPILEREGVGDQMNVRVFDTTDLVIEG
jgi:hypothetical protein